MDNDDSNNQREERSLFLRIACCVLWFIPFYLATGAIVGGVVGAIAWTQSGNHSDDYAAGAAVAGPAVQDFFHKNGFFVVAFQIMAYAALCLLRWVPGVSKFKRMKRQ